MWEYQAAGELRISIYLLYLRYSNSNPPTRPELNKTTGATYDRGRQRGTTVSSKTAQSIRAVQYITARHFTVEEETRKKKNTRRDGWVTPFILSKPSIKFLDHCNLQETILDRVGLGKLSTLGVYGKCTFDRPNVTLYPNPSTMALTDQSISQNGSTNFCRGDPALRCTQKLETVPVTACTAVPSQPSPASMFSHLTSGFDGRNR